jgi:hypothetical protein
MRPTTTRILGAIAAAFTLGAAATDAAAHASLDGHQLRIEYGIDLDGDGTSFAWQALQGADVTGGAGVEWTVSLGPPSNPAQVRWDVDVDEEMLLFRYTGTGDFMNFGTPPLMGFRVWDKFGELLPIEGVHVMNTTYTPGVQGNLVEGFVPATDLPFDSEGFYVNLWNSMYHHQPMGSMGDPTRDLIALHVAFAPVPEPSTYVLMLAGLGLIAGRRLKRRAAQ